MKHTHTHTHTYADTFIKHQHYCGPVQKERQSLDFRGRCHQQL